MRCFTVTTEPCPPSLPRGPPPGPASRPRGWTHGQTHRWTVPLRQGSSWKPCGRSLPHLNEKHPRARASCPGGSGSVSTCFGAVVRPASAGTGQPPRAHIPAAQSRLERALCPPPSWSPHLGYGQWAPCWATPA